MILRLLLIVSLCIAVPACGVKNDLLTPSGQQTAKGEKDPSRPAQPIGR